MKLRDAVRLHAGGPGSGCHGPNCGRPPGNVNPTPWDNKTPTNEYFKVPGNGYRHDRYSEQHVPLVVKYEHKPGYPNPTLHLVAGGSASGKSTFAWDAAQELRTPAVLNTDQFRAELPEYMSNNENIAGALHEEAGDVRDLALASALSHQNDIVLDAPGSPSLAKTLDQLEPRGYKVEYTYVHRPVEEAIQLSAFRAKNAKDPADRRNVPESVIRASHVKARTAFGLIAKPGREVRIYDGTGAKRGERYPIVYHRLADGTVVVNDRARLDKIINGEEPKLKLP